MDLFRVKGLLLLLLVFLVYLDISSACPARRQYSRNKLLQLNIGSTVGVFDISSQFPEIIRRRSNKSYGGAKENGRKKRGKRGGVRLRLKRTLPNRLQLPLMILGNIRSLRNKVDELQGNIRFLKDFKDCCLMAIRQDQQIRLNSDTTAVRVTAAHSLFKATERYVGGLILFGLERFITHYH